MLKASIYNPTRQKNDTPSSLSALNEAEFSITQSSEAEWLNLFQYIFQALFLLLDICANFKHVVLKRRKMICQQKWVQNVQKRESFLEFALTFFILLELILY